MRNNPDNLDPDEPIEDEVSLDEAEMDNVATEEEPADSGEDENQIADEAEWSSESKDRKKRLEAVLFLSRQPMTSRKLSDQASLEDGTQARTMIRELNDHYDQLGRAFSIKRVAGGFQMFTRPQFAKWIRRLEHVPRPSRLSGPLMETLAVVAYRQPILKAEVEAIRGVSCGEMLRQLLEKSLIKIAGRSPELGRPFLYATSKNFLTHFGLYSIDQIPRAKQLQGKGLPAWTTMETSPEAETDASSAVRSRSNEDDSHVDSKNNDSISTTEEE